MSATNPGGRSGPVTIVRNAGRWLTVMGIVFVVLGILAIVEPAVAGLAVAILVGWLLIFGAMLMLVMRFSPGGLAGLVGLVRRRPA